MLILTRRIGEALKIGQYGEITVTVLQNNGNQVRLGIDADKNIPINREEVYLRIKRQEAAGISNCQ